jgi:toxin FitB
LKALLDTCVVTEHWKPKPMLSVSAWIDEQGEDKLLLSALTLGEIQKGIERVTGTKRAEGLRASLQALEARFEGRILPANSEITKVWGELAARREKSGHPLAVVDGLLAATCIVHGLAMVTRNVRDFEDLSLQLINPWEALRSSPR